jgi:diguanylate cyclase (GGDEF)-like protein
MRYEGRITVTILMVFAFSFEIVQFYWLEGYFYNKITLLAFIPFAYLGWWLGEHYDQVKYASNTDALTNAYNRRFVTEQFPKMTAKADRRKENLLIFVIDVNEFKVINDTFGHPAGDVVLKNIANALLYLKKGKCKVVRWGGDEFLILLPIKNNQLPAVHHQAVEELMQELSLKLKKSITVAVGRAVYPEDGRTLDGLIQVADKQMYSVKHHTKSREIS